ncbi:MAG: hypothetical protein J1F63_00770 [Oscillospiraceae bacterium]|nr:hypothetical protein [Oscillospiraceae bacterium]
MFKENKQYIAVIMIVVLAAAMVTMYAVNRRNQQAQLAGYAEAVSLFQERQAARIAAADEREHRRAEAAETVAFAASVHLPGVAFYGTNLSYNEVGASLPVLVEALIDQNVYDSPVSTVNVLDPHETALQKTYLPVIFINADAWDGTIDGLISRQNELIAGRERYIVLGMPTGSREEMMYVEAAMLAEYGEKYINLREYLSTDGMASISLPISEADMAAMAEGRIPPGLLASDGVNLNESGYKLAAFLTYDRMSELGYFNEVLSAIDEYNEKVS